jgi:hypothetical protein
MTTRESASQKESECEDRTEKGREREKISTSEIPIPKSSYINIIHPFRFISIIKNFGGRGD